MGPEGRDEEVRSPGTARAAATRAALLCVVRNYLGTRKYISSASRPCRDPPLLMKIRYIRAILRNECKSDFEYAYTHGDVLCFSSVLEPGA